MKRSTVRRAIMPLALSALLLLQSAGSAFGSFTIEDEKKLGKEFYDKLDKHDFLIRNARVNDYVSQLGNRILAHSEKAPFEYRFSVIRSAAVNAFATPGGYVYLNRGLITLVDNEAELAGVLAHEIAHVNARHIASIIEKSTKLSIATLAAVIAGAFLGGGGDLSAGLMGLSLAAATTLNLKYSREHEEEADRLGMTYLVGAGYNPQGMPDFLKLMRRYDYYSSTVPTYFRTHPATDERIHYLDALLQTTYRQKGRDNITGRLKRIQTLLMFNNTNLNSTLKHFQERLEKNPGNIDDLYGMAVTYDKLGQTDKALSIFQSIVGKAGNDQDILRDMGIVYFKQGKSSEAIPLLQKALNIDPGDEQTIQYLGRSYSATGDYASALDIYKKIEGKPLDDADLYYNIALAYGKTNDPGSMHYYFGLHFKKSKKTESALHHFRAALAYYPKGSSRADDIDKQIKSLKDKPGKK